MVLVRHVTAIHVERVVQRLVARQFLRLPGEAPRLGKTERAFCGDALGERGRRGRRWSATA
jgi:hypothetical protein